MNKTTRRDFLRNSAVTGAGFWLLAGATPKTSFAANERISFAGVGIGGKGGGDIANAAKYCDIVAVCDVDRKRLADALKKYPNAKGFTDYRELLDTMGDKIDALNISTADHTHACCALKAMRMKKHVYVQKPLSRTIYEARLMAKVAQETGVCTQMGNQGSADDKLRNDAARLKIGANGNVKELHVWTNRPIWPQGPGIAQTLASFKSKMEAEMPDTAADEIAKMDERIKNDLAKNIDWESWLGPAPYREYFPEIYHAFKWRGFWDFGTGALGDIACHSLNKYMAGLDVSAPTSVVATTSGHDFNSFPSWSVIEYEFPDTAARPGFKFIWYDGGKRPAPELLKKYKFAENALGGDFVVYEEGTERPAEMPVVRLCPTHPDHPDADSRNMFELVCAIKENNPELCFSNFPKQAGPLTEAMLLGNLAVWTAFEPEKKGEEIRWDAANMTVTNLSSIKTPKTADLIKPIYRSGYQLD